MKTETECLHCFREQIRRTALLQKLPAWNIEEILQELDDQLSKTPLNASPPEIAGMAYRFLSEKTKEPDPYREIKNRSTDLILSNLAIYKQYIQDSEDPLKAALELSGFGNMIDYGADPDFSLGTNPPFPDNIVFSIFDLEKFKSQLQKSRTVLYLADNAGESVFDKLLIEMFGKEVIYAVKAEPIINDVLRSDAAAAGINETACIISSGSVYPGTVLHSCTPEFLRIYHQADMIISKGQGNYEALCEESRSIFFLLKVKCNLISRHLHAPIGTLVLKCNQTT